jgi:hypothetical protein
MMYPSESSFTSQSISYTCSTLLREALQSPQTYTQDILTATRLYNLVYHVRRTHSFQAVHHKSDPKGDTVARRLLLVIASYVGTVGQPIDEDTAEACARIEQYSSIA